MKTITPLFAQIASGHAAVVPPLPSRNSAGSRPVRRGNFWPGENFTNRTNKWDLTGVFLGQAFVLPTLSGDKGSRTL